MQHLSRDLEAREAFSVSLACSEMAISFRHSLFLGGCIPRVCYWSRRESSHRNDIKAGVSLTNRGIGMNHIVG